VLLVGFRPRASRTAKLSAANEVGGRRVLGIPQIGTEAIAVAAGSERRAAWVLRRRFDVARVERDPVVSLESHRSCGAGWACVMPNDPLFSSQWGLANDTFTKAFSAGAVRGADIAASSAWAYSKGSPAVRIAIVDSGVDDRHPDLRGKVVDEATLSANGGDRADYVGHGTAIAGVAGAIPNNGIGIAGVGYNSSLMDVKVAYDDLGGSLFTDCAGLATGIVYAASHHAQVINVSLGGRYCAAEALAAAYAWSRGSLVVAAAGNQASQTPTYPAALPNVISVGATDNSDRRAGFSNYGANWVDIAAPGVNIESTLPRYANRQGATNYGLMEGTSFAAPMVAGAAALLWPTVADTNHDGQVNDEVRSRLLRYADRTAGTGSDWRAGRLDVCRALTADSAPCPPRSTPPPTLTNTEARSGARRALARAFKRSFAQGRAYSGRCQRASRTRFRCQVVWAYAQDDYYGTVAVWSGVRARTVTVYDQYVIHSVNGRCYLTRGGPQCRVRTYRGR
jgi:thermitase